MQYRQNYPDFSMGWAPKTVDPTLHIMQTNVIVSLNRLCLVNAHMAKRPRLSLNLFSKLKPLLCVSAEFIASLKFPFNFTF